MQELLKHFHEISLHPNNARQLKDLILQLAMQGKLTAVWRESHPELVSGSNSAENLLKKIKAEKALLIKNKTIKKEKPLFPVDPEEVNYKLPKEWIWTKLGEVGRIVGGGTPKTNISDYYSENGIPWLTPADLGKFKGVYIERGRRDISEKGLAKSSAQLMPKGSVLFSSRAPIGHTAIANNPICTNQGFKSCVPHISDSNKFIYYYLNSIVTQINSEASGTTFKEVSGTDVKNFLLPLAPIQEQQEIVRVIEIIFKEIEKLENLTEKRIELKKDYAFSALNQLAGNDSKAEWQALKPQFHEFFDEVDNIKKLRETILQLAVQGKLTAKWRAQNPDLISGNNSAENLLKEIKAKKEKLIKEKKIKKEKALPPITKDEIPFELPEGWVWCRMGDVGNAITSSFVDGPFGSSINTKKDYIESGVPVLRMVNVKPYHFKNDSMKYISEEKYQSFLRHGVIAGDILFSKVGAGIGEACIVPNTFEYGMLSTTGISRIRVGQIVSNEYLCHFINGHISYFKSLSQNSAQPFLNMTQIKSVQFPLAPTQEQKIIVQRVNSFMNLCNQLEKEIETGQQLLEDLMQSILKEVFEGEKELKENLMTTEA